jgi:hypothetical protein
VNASADRTAMMQQEEAETQKALARAVADIMAPGDESRSIQRVAKTRGVSEKRLRDALHARGWKPVRIRQTNSRSQAKQLPPARSDNQT